MRPTIKTGLPGREISNCVFRRAQIADYNRRSGINLPKIPLFLLLWRSNEI